MPNFFQISETDIINLDKIQEVLLSREKDGQGNAKGLMIEFENGKHKFLQGAEAAHFWDALGRMPGLPLSDESVSYNEVLGPGGYEDRGAR